jgi:DNA-binding cell septation regulator SpoVG
MNMIRIELAVVNAKPPLRALADVVLLCDGEELRVRRCAVFQKSGEPPWVSLPSLPIEKNGKKTYLPPVELSRELKQRVFDAVLAEYQKATNES